MLQASCQQRSHALSDLPLPFVLQSSMTTTKDCTSESQRQSIHLCVPCLQDSR